MSVHMGYIGSARVNGSQYYLTGASLNPVQNINAPELIQGRHVKHLWNFAPVEIQGNMTGPVSEDHSSLYSLAYDRNATDPDHMATAGFEVDICYYRNIGRRFKNCQINSYEVSVTSGDVANFTVDFFGAGTSESDALDVSPTWGSANCNKLVTWDRCSFEISGETSIDVQAFTFSLQNNLQRVYRLDGGGGTTSLFPFEVVAGFRDVTGTVTIYASGAPESMFPTSSTYGAENYSDYNASDHKSCTMTIGNPSVIDQTFNAVFRRPEAAGRTDVMVYTLNYQGLCIET